MKKKTYKLSFFSYLMITLIVFSVMFGTFMLSSAYFSTAKIVTGEINLAGLDFQILNNFSQINTFENNLFMPDEIINNAITILNARDEEGLSYEGLVPIYVRIKPVLLINSVDNLECLQIELKNTSEWIKGADGFLYCTQKLLIGQQIRFNDYFVLSYLISNEHQNLPIYLGLEVEAVQSDNLAYLDVWQTAPLDWKNAVI